MELIKSYLTTHIEKGLTKPTHLLQYIPEELRNSVTTVQITIYIQRRKKILNLNNQTPSQLNIFDMQRWVVSKYDIPDSEDMDKSFVVSYEIETNTIRNSVPSFRIYVSTRRLIGLSSRRDMWQVDATYKLNWQGYPLLVIGLSDFPNNFILSDGAYAQVRQQKILNF
jgi:hypothetical protein